MAFFSVSTVLCINVQIDSTYIFVVKLNAVGLIIEDSGYRYMQL
jgi:hypothetical protein